MSTSKDPDRKSAWPTGAEQDGLAGKRPRVTPRSGARSAGASATLYERYKDALRRGHVAALRGRNAAAIDAYGEAAAIAPDRALPHASIGGILVKMNRPEDAVAAYGRALTIAPRDEVALRGIAEAQVRLGRRTDAAESLDRLAGVLDDAGRLADATDAARRALELAESRTRRTHVEALAERLRTASPGDEAAQRALDQALRMLEPVIVEAEPELESAVPELEAAGEAPVIEPAAAPAVAVEAVSELEAAAGVADEVEAEPDAAVEAEAEPVADAAIELAIEAEPAVVAEPVAPPEAPVEPEALEAGAFDADASNGAGTADVEALPDAAAVEAAPVAEVKEPVGLGIALGAAAEAHLFAGDLAEAHAGLLAAARAHRRAGRHVAAVDACYLAIGLAPSDPDLHLLLAELYLDRGWRTQAADKLLLLGRLADLDADTETHRRLCELVSTRLADEPRVAELCA